MQFVSENSTADDGAQVQSGVILDVDGIGVVEKPWRVNVSVDRVMLYTSHHATKAQADAARTREHMQAAGITMHDSTVTHNEEAHDA